MPVDHIKHKNEILPNNSSIQDSVDKNDDLEENWGNMYILFRASLI